MCRVAGSKLRLGAVQVQLEDASSHIQPFVPGVHGIALPGASTRNGDTKRLKEWGGHRPGQ